jgi:hypothetical protein
MVRKDHAKRRETLGEKAPMVMMLTCRRAGALRMLLRAFSGVQESQVRTTGESLDC